jgi:hypothetical protein
MVRLPVACHLNTESTNDHDYVEQTSGEDQDMWRSVLAIAVTAILSVAFLAACNGDDAADDGITLTDDEPATPIDEHTPADDEEVTDDSDDMGAARTDEDTEDPDPQSAGEAEDEDGLERVSENVDVTLVDHEIEIQDSSDPGIVVFVITNDGEEEHGLSVEPANGNEEEEIIGTMLVEPGETEQLELELEEGEYMLFCPVGDHRDEHGMETEFSIE